MSHLKYVYFESYSYLEITSMNPYSSALPAVTSAVVPCPKSWTFSSWCCTFWPALGLQSLHNTRCLLPISGVSGLEEWKCFFVLFGRPGSWASPETVPLQQPDTCAGYQLRRSLPSWRWFPLQRNNIIRWKWWFPLQRDTKIGWK